MKKCIAGVLILSSISSVSAQTGPGVAANPVTANVTVASQYVFRGLSQTDGKPALQGGVDYAHPSGFYAGTWLSNISWYTDQNAGIASAPVSLASPGSVGAPYDANRSNAASMEWDLYGGYKGGFGDGWSYDVGAIRYLYPGRFENVGAYRRPDTTELYGALGYRWLSLKYSRAISTYTFGVNESKGAGYLDLSASVPLAESGFALLAHVGRQDFRTMPTPAIGAPPAVTTAISITRTTSSA